MARPRNSQHVFTRKPPDRKPLTSESIATDLEAFQAAGGAIEVLGITRTFKHIAPDAPALQPDEPVPRKPIR